MNTKKRLHNELAKLWNIAVFKKYGYVCVCCGERATAPHHYIPRSKSLVLRYDVMNGIPLCNSCHYLIHFSHNPEETRRLCEVIRTKRGKDWCKYIEDRKRIVGHNALWWLKIQKEKLEVL